MILRRRECIHVNVCAILLQDTGARLGSHLRGLNSVAKNAKLAERRRAASVDKNFESMVAGKVIAEPFEQQQQQQQAAFVH